MSAAPTAPWFFVPRRLARPRLRLFALPYAGGSATIYRQWAGQLGTDVELCAIQLPGRGARLREPPLTRMEPLVAALVEAVAPLDDAPYALFGHSMGAEVALELARRLAVERRPPPARLLLSGRFAPGVRAPVDPPLYNRPHDQFVAELRRMRGTPEAILADPEMLELVLPALRADFEVLDTFRSPPTPPVDARLVVFGGRDEVGERVAGLEAWRAYTTGSFALHLLPGHHFFLHTAQESLLALLRDELAA